MPGPKSSAVPCPSWVPQKTRVCTPRPAGPATPPCTAPPAPHISLTVGFAGSQVSSVTEQPVPKGSDSDAGVLRGPAGSPLGCTHPCYPPRPALPPSCLTHSPRGSPRTWPAQTLPNPFHRRQNRGLTLAGLGGARVTLGSNPTPQTPANNTPGGDSPPDSASQAPDVSIFEK